MINGFFAYPSQLSDVKTAIHAALELLRKSHGQNGISTWEENDISGRLLATPIFQKLDSIEFLFADITRLNLNVTFEIGYAIGRNKRIILLKNGTIRSEEDLLQQIGIFDTLGHERYNSSKELANIILTKKDKRPIKPDAEINRTSPVYILLPRYKSDFEVHLVAKIKKARLQYRSFDPEEQVRLPAMVAINNVAASYGVVVPLLDSSRVDAETHNIRAAFIAGLATGMHKELVIFHNGTTPVPLDYRDAVAHISNLNQTDRYIGDFASAITARLQQKQGPKGSTTDTLLATLSLGASTAENEMSDLDDYYLETEEYRRALRGEAQIIAGRKGSGKSALFFRVRNKLRRSKQNIVLDLRPEGFQLLKFKDVVLEHLETGTKEHTITAFWEYLLLLETCYKLLEKDKHTHIYDHELNDAYHRLATEYQADPFISEADFAERLLQLTQRIATDFEIALGGGKKKQRLNKEEVTHLLYKHDAKRLREMICEYLAHKDGLWIMFDNLDKGWPPHGLEPEDLTILRCLVDASTKLEKFLQNRHINCHNLIFLRNDIYELLLENTSDRGKIHRITIDWSDGDLLREILRLRFVASGANSKNTFQEIWHQICVSHVGAEESSDYLIDRCLMRPRCLIDLLQHCRSQALNLKHTKIEVDDIHKGEASYSADLVSIINYEIRDVHTQAQDLLYSFVMANARLSCDDLDFVLAKAGIAEIAARNKLVDLLLWYGFLGIEKSPDNIIYIYNVKYDIKRLNAIAALAASNTPSYCINPAFWSGLDINITHHV